MTLRLLVVQKSRISHHDAATGGTATYRLQNPGVNVRLPSFAAVSGDQDDRPPWVKGGHPKNLWAAASAGKESRNPNAKPRLQSLIPPRANRHAPNPALSFRPRLQ
jgi:hypothetical protein